MLDSDFFRTRLDRPKLFIEQLLDPRTHARTRTHTHTHTHTRARAHITHAGDFHEARKLVHLKNYKSRLFNIIIIFKNQNHHDRVVVYPIVGFLLSFIQVIIRPFKKITT